MSEARADLDLARREAADWLERLNQPVVSTSTLMDFRAWRREPVRAAAYRELVAAWTAKGARQPGPGLAEPGAAEGRRGLLPAYLVGPGPDWLKGAILVVGLAGVAAAQDPLFDRGRAYRTGLGEQRLIVLEDGSRVRLDTDTILRVKFRPRDRGVVLERGQAYFEVAPDPARPFRVRSAWTEVRAVGTAFDVRRGADTVRVILVSGRVQVRRVDATAATGWALTPGQQIDVGPRPGAVRRRAVEARSETSWISGRLVFRGEALEAAIAEVNRYARTPVRLEAPSLAATPISGSFEAGNTQAFVAAVAALYGLRAVPSSDGTVRLRPLASGRPDTPSR